MTIVRAVLRAGGIVLLLMPLYAASAEPNVAEPGEQSPPPVAQPSPPVTPIDSATTEPAAPDASPIQTPPKAEDAAAPAETPKPQTNVATIVQEQVAPILGKKVVGPADKEVIGSITDLLVDSDGRPRAAIVDVGGFLGVGSRRVAVDWQVLKFRADKPDAPALLNLDPAELKAAPEYKDVSAPAKVVEPTPQMDTTAPAAAEPPQQPADSAAPDAPPIPPPAPPPANDAGQ